MDDPLKIDLAIVARDLKLPPEKIETTVKLLDEGNTIPFITRFRKDLTGELNEQQILAIKQRVSQLRALAERKAFVLKSVESQNKLTDSLKQQIAKATTARRLEDLYLPFKPKKQSRASLARQQGLEPLADDIFQATSPDVEIATRATDFVRVDKGLTSVDEVIKGVGDLLAERFSENDALRNDLRRIMWSEGKLTAQAIVQPDNAVATESTTDSPVSKTQNSDAAKTPATQPPSKTQTARLPQADGVSSDTEQKQEKAPLSVDRSESNPTTAVDADEKNPGQTDAESGSTPVDPPTAPADSNTEPAAPPEASVETAPDSNSETGAAATTADAGAANAADEATHDSEKTAEPTQTDSLKPGAAESQPPASSANADGDSGQPVSTASEPKPTEPTPSDPNAEVAPASPANEATAAPTQAAGEPAKPKKKKKKKKKKPADDPFKDYKDFKQPIKQVPNHRVLAINRGERAGSLKVKISVDGDKLTKVANEALVPETHPFREFLQKCANDALSRMLIPSLEREIRRELTETAEKHAVEVFANNLRNLLLQPPIRNRTVLAIDPGFKRGCSVAILDPLGDVLDSGHVFVVGNQTRRTESQQKIANWVRQYNVDVIAIGNGAACRQTEQMVSDAIAEQLADLKTTYVMVNEAGASIYSTSEIGRSELPNASPSIRSAASIGRRLQDPLSELVKISPANIGVGMYQHDVKAKHLSESLDEVVQFCVNRVGVDVNSASPSLLKYVSGMNSLTARRVVEHRQSNGQFKNRDQLKEVSGFGDATFVQSAGFLRVHGGDTPLDCTSIHPESYDIANDVLSKIGVSAEEFFPKPPAPSTPPAPKTESAGTESTDNSTQPPEASTAESAANSEAAESTPTASTPTESPESQPKLSNDTSTPDSDATDVQADATDVQADAAAPVAPKETVSSSESGQLPSAETPAPVDGPPAEKTLEPVTDSPTKATESSPGVNPDPAVANRKELLSKINELSIDELATQHSAGKLLIKDILMALKRPKWDPRDKVHKPIFRRGIIKADDLKPEMQLDGQVVNVVDFGVFVDIGLGESSLVHVSQLSNHFIRDPHRLYSVGDVLKVWVSEIDPQRRRVKLTAVRPGSKRPPNRRSRGSGAASAESRSSRGPAVKPGKYGKPYGGNQGKQGQRSRSGKPGAYSKSHARKSKPKEIKPITEEMLKGDEPMRSFSDLAQFVNKKPKDDKSKK